MTSSSGFARGDVVSVEFPFADGVGVKDRPALVLAGPSLHGDYTVVMISSEKQDDGVPITHGDFASGSLASASHVRVRKLYTLAKSLVVTKRGTLKPTALGKVLAELCPALGCKS